MSLDKVEALKWFNLAAAQRDEDAENYLRVLTPSLSAEENAEAQRLAKEWLTSHTQ
jgi:TPR repeat protein